MPLYDVSLLISENLPTWPGDHGIKLKKTSQIKDGDMVNLTHLSTSVHTGTHVDAPDHFLGDGDTVENIPLNLLVGPAEVVELDTGKQITADDLQNAGLKGKCPRLLIKTSNSNFWAESLPGFQEDFIALEAGAATYLVKCGVEVIGVDYLSVAPYHDPEPTHQILLDAGILIIEGLNLTGIQPGPYQLYCLPLKISGSDGAPARVLLEGE